MRDKKIISRYEKLNLFINANPLSREKNGELYESLQPLFQDNLEMLALIESYHQIRESIVNLRKTYALIEEIIKSKIPKENK